MKRSHEGYRALLTAELGSRKARNASYSLRAFARDLGVSVTALSGVLGARRNLSKRNALRVAERLALSPRETDRLLREIRGEAPGADAGGYLALEEDAFRLIADWHYFAVLSLARLPANQGSARWVAGQLGIPEVRAREALQRLERLGYLRIEAGRLVRTALPLRTTRDVPSAALRSHHRQNLERAARALEDVPVERREISSVTFAVDSSRLEEAKDLIVAFRRKLSRLMQSESPDSVYTFATQLFPATGAAPRRRAGGKHRKTQEKLP